MQAAKERTVFDGEVLPQAKPRVWGVPLENANGIGHRWPASPTLHWGWSPFYDGTASGELDQRYYAVGTGRFNAPDPSSGSSAGRGIPGSWNRYAYVGGDPMNFTDPGGNRRVCVGYSDDLWCWDEPEPGGGSGGAGKGRNDDLELDLPSDTESPVDPGYEADPLLDLAEYNWATSVAR